LTRWKNPDSFSSQKTKMKTIIRAGVVSLLILSGWAACRKTMNSSSAGERSPFADSVALEPTAIGTPVGQLVTQTVGSSGAVVLSADSMVELHIPSGALTAGTQVGIQAITNNLPNGAGNAYRFTPQGLKFAVPATVIFHFTADQKASTIPMLMGIAFQDSTQNWEGLASVSVDTINNSISGKIPHFSDWGIFLGMTIDPQHTQLGVGKSQILEVSTLQEVQNRSQGSGDMLAAPLISRRFRNVTWLVNGAVNGSSTYGTVALRPSSSSGTNFNSSVLYTAPARVPNSGNPVSVVARFQGPILDDNGQQWNQIELVANIKVVSGIVFSLDIVDVENDRFVTGINYYDSARIYIIVKPDYSIVIDPDSIFNFPPQVDPGSAVEGNCTYTWQKDQIGTVNVLTATGSASAISPDSLFLLVTVTNDSHTPVFDVACPNSNGTYSPPPMDKTLVIPAIIQPGDSVYEEGGATQVHYRFTRINTNGG
jgi:hypothetical protein